MIQLYLGTKKAFAHSCVVVQQSKLLQWKGGRSACSQNSLPPPPLSRLVHSQASPFLSHKSRSNKGLIGLLIWEEVCEDRSSVGSTAVIFKYEVQFQIVETYD